VSAKKWSEAKGPLEQLLELYPAQKGKDSAYPLLTHVHRVLGETNEEMRVLKRYVAEDDEASDAFLRLAELATQSGDWAEVRRNSERFLSVNPLVAAPYRYMALAAENQGEPAVAISANRTLLLLDPPNPSEVHYRLARLLHQSKDPGAKRQLLMALEDAPRHRAGLELLLELNRGATNATKPPP
jgi:tetratricopeptide (TPR) repeat protein